MRAHLAEANPAGRRDLTWVELVHQPNRVERWIRFGPAADERVIDRRSRLVAFAPGAVFAFVRWTANDYGTVISRIDLLQAVAVSEARSTIPRVTPGAEILLRQAGWPRVEAVLKAIDAVETAGFDPCTVAPDYWRHVHHRMTAAERFRPYTSDRHAAWQARRTLLS